jgi:cation:H+ antiporter
MFLPIILLLIGLIVLVFGAEYLVKGAASISKKAGVPPLVIGLTVVAFGTSAPELIVNIFSAINGTTDLALGNIIGSNLANILFILGLTSLIATLKVARSTVWKEIPFALLAVVMVYIMANDRLLDGAAVNALTRSDGLALLGFFVIFMYYTVALAKGGEAKAEDEEIGDYPYGLALAFTFGGLLALFFGGKLLVSQAVILAKLAGLSESFIGLTVVAIGTSLPELFTSVMAARRGHVDIAIGNVVGSNIFNIFWILGLTSLIAPIPVSFAGSIDILATFLATLLLFFAMFVGRKHQLSRLEGVFFLTSYFAYIAYLLARGA